MSDARQAATALAFEDRGHENARFGMWVFLSAECAFFACLIGTYLALGGRTLGGPGPGALFDIPVTLTATLVLLVSSLTMVLAVSAIEREAPDALKAWLAVTAALGVVFLGFEAYDFSDYWSRGVTLQGTVFGSSIYTLLGFHGLHVAFGIFWILSLLRISAGLTADNAVKTYLASLYWHFVDVVWIVIFSVVYLVGKAT